MGVSIAYAPKALLGHALIYLVSAAVLRQANDAALQGVASAPVLLAMQNTLAVVFIWLAAKAHPSALNALPSLSSLSAMRWAPLACMYAIARSTSLEIQRAGVGPSAWLVLGSVAMLAVAVGERWYSGTKLGWSGAAALGSMALGATIVGAHEVRSGAVTGREGTIIVCLTASSIYCLALRSLARKESALSTIGMAFACHVWSVPVLVASSVLHLEGEVIKASLAIAADEHEQALGGLASRPRGGDASRARNAAAAATAALIASGFFTAVLGISTVFLHRRLTATSNMAIANGGTLVSVVLAATFAGSPASAPSYLTGAACFIASACVYFSVQERPDRGETLDRSDGTTPNSLFFGEPIRKSTRVRVLPPTLALCGMVLLSAWLSRPLDQAAHLQKPISMRLVVITGGTRIDSLYRLIESLSKLEGDGDRIDLDVWIDVPEPEDLIDGVLSEKSLLAQDIEMLGKNGSYRNGLVRAHIWEQHMGLRGQWLDAWHASIPGGLTEDTQEIGLILEDDMQLSPFAWRWLKAAYAAYGQDRRVAGFTVQRATLCLARCPNINGGPDGAGGGFFYPLIGTWGYSPTARSFARFRRWYYSLPQNFKPYVEGTSPTDWYKSFEKAGTETKRMWEMHHIKYTDTHEDKYTVYVKCKDNKTLGVNHRETGLNFDGKDPAKKGAMHRMLTEWDPDLIRFRRAPFVLNYSAVVVEGLGLAGGLAAPET